MTAPTAAAAALDTPTCLPDHALRGAHYERLSQLLVEADAARARTRDPSLIHFVEAAHRLFDTCRAYQNEAQVHLEGYFATQQRELELLRQLHAIIDTVLNAGSSPSSVAMPARLGRRTQAPQEGDAVLPMPAAAQLPEQVHGPPVACVAAHDLLQSPALDVYFLSAFQVFRDDRQITDWPNSKGRNVFKYLVANRDRPVPKEVLMDVFWPGAEPHAARNNLNVAVYGLRRELATDCVRYPFILFQGGCYLLNPELRIWVDAEAFREHREAALRLEQQGEIELAVQQYRAAEVLYQQPYLAEDRYEAWIEPLRSDAERAYLEIVDRLSQHYFELKDYDACVLVCRKMLGVDSCDEAAHRLLMRCYVRLGQSHLALRQFHTCVEALARELKLYPSPQTVELFKRVKQQQPV